MAILCCVAKNSPRGTEPLEGLGCISEPKSHEQKFPQAERLGNRWFRNVRFGNGNLMIGFNQVDFRKNGATRHAVIERLCVLGRGYLSGIVTVFRRR